MRYNRWTAMLLAVAMTMSLFTASTWAAETKADDSPEAVYAEENEAPESEPESAEEAEAPKTESVLKEKSSTKKGEQVSYRYWVNPMYKNVVSKEDIEAKLEELKQTNLETQATAKTFTTVKAAGKYLRGELKKRKSSITLILKTKNSDHDSLWYEVYDEAVKITGVPTEGDYISGNIFGYGNSWSSGRKEKTQYINTLCYKPYYTSNAKQEKQVDAEVKKVLKQMNLKKDSDFVKLHKIYNFVCTNITYDDEGLEKDEDLCHSTYSAIVLRKTVCQGYSTLMYRLLMECGVPCRYILSKGSEHVWNIVKLDGKYYNVDATWDSGNYYENTPYEWFLLPDDKFEQDEPYHVRKKEFRTKDFYKQHPMAKTEGLITYHFWNIESVLRKPTCTKEGLRKVYCVYCGIEDQRTIPALDHDWQVYKQESYWDGSYKWYYCARCGLTDDENDYDYDGFFYPYDKYDPFYVQSAGLGTQDAVNQRVKGIKGH